MFLWQVFFVKWNFVKWEQNHKAPGSKNSDNKSFVRLIKTNRTKWKRRNKKN